MKKQFIALVAACAFACPLALVGCSGNSDAPASDSTDDTPAAEQSGDFDASETYWGQWRGSVDTTGTTAYGTASGSEPMLDLNLEQDGSCTVEPLKSHADLPTDSGTWEGTETEITLHLETAGDVTMTMTDNVTGQADATAFGIEGFDTIHFEFFG